MVESQGVSEGLAGGLDGEHVLVVADREPRDGGDGHGVDDDNWVLLRMLMVTNTLIVTELMIINLIKPMMTITLG